VGAGCGGEKTGQEVARVGDQALTVEEMASLTSRGEKGLLSDDEKREFVLQWVDTEVLYRQAIREKLDQDSRVIHAIQQMEKELLAAELMERRVGREMAIDNTEIEQFYLDHQDSYVLAERRVRARHILLESADKARLIRDQLDQGRSFETLVKEASIDTATIPRGGDLGFFFADEMVPEFSRVAFGLIVNEVSQPVRTERGYHIIQVTGIQPEGAVLPLEEVKDDIANTIFALKQRRLFDATIKELKNNEKIEIYWDRIDFDSPLEPTGKG